MTSLQDRAREARLAAGFKTVPKWAKKLGLSTAAIYLIEGGKTLDLKAGTASGMAKLSGLSAEWIRTGKGERRGAPSPSLPVPLPPVDRVRVLEQEIDGLKAIMTTFLTAFSRVLPGAAAEVDAGMAALPAPDSEPEEQVREAAKIAVAKGLQSAARAARRGGPRGSPGKPPRKDR